MRSQHEREINDRAWYRQYMKDQGGVAWEEIEAEERREEIRAVIAKTPRKPVKKMDDEPRPREFFLPL